MLNILYVHGYGGHENGSSSSIIRKALKDNGIDANVYAPPIPLDNPEEAIRFVVNAASGMDLVIASSLGALVSLFSPDHRKLLINIAFPKDIEENIPEYSKGKLDYLQKKLDILLNNVDVEDKECMYFLFGENDKIAHNIDEISSKYGNAHIFSNSMGHELDETASDDIAEIVKIILEDKNNKVFVFQPMIKGELDEI